eukprot:scaffold12600_cov107-Isochrysis_galbana.AAC.3
MVAVIRVGAGQRAPRARTATPPGVRLAGVWLGRLACLAIHRRASRLVRPRLLVGRSSRNRLPLRLGCRRWPGRLTRRQRVGGRRVDPPSQASLLEHVGPSKLGLVPAVDASAAVVGGRTGHIVPVLVDPQWAWTGERQPDGRARGHRLSEEAVGCPHRLDGPRHAERRPLAHPALQRGAAQRVGQCRPLLAVARQQLGRVAQPLMLDPAHQPLELPPQPRARPGRLGAAVGALVPLKARLARGVAHVVVGVHPVARQVDPCLTRVAAHHHFGLLRVVVVHARADAAEALLQSGRRARGAPDSVVTPPPAAHFAAALAAPAVSADEQAAGRRGAGRARPALQYLVAPGATRRPRRQVDRRVDGRVGGLADGEQPAARAAPADEHLLIRLGARGRGAVGVEHLGAVRAPEQLGVRWPRRGLVGQPTADEARVARSGQARAEVHRRVLLGRAARLRLDPPLRFGQLAAAGGVGVGHEVRLEPREGGVDALEAGLEQPLGHEVHPLVWPVEGLRVLADEREVVAEARQGRQLHVAVRAHIHFRLHRAKVHRPVHHRVVLRGQRVLDRDRLAEELVPVLLLQLGQHLRHERVGLAQPAQAVGVQPVAPRVQPEPALVALDHPDVRALVHGQADRAPAAGLAHRVVGPPLLSVPRAARRAAHALWAFEAAEGEALERRVEATDVVALVAVLAHRQPDLGAVLRAHLARFALEAPPLFPRAGPRLQTGLQTAKVETVAAAMALERVALVRRVAGPRALRPPRRRRSGTGLLHGLTRAAAGVGLIRVPRG